MYSLEFFFVFETLPSASPPLWFTHHHHPHWSSLFIFFFSPRKPEERECLKVKHIVAMPGLVVSVEARLLLGPVRALNALELGLDSALVLEVAREAPLVLVRATADLAPHLPQTQHPANCGKDRIKQSVSTRKYFASSTVQV